MSNVPRVCQCYMFKNLGTCWHTGYRPKFVPDLRELPSRAERRRRAFLELLKETRPNDPDQREEG